MKNNENYVIKSKRGIKRPTSPILDSIAKNPFKKFRLEMRCNKWLYSRTESDSTFEEPAESITINWAKTAPPYIIRAKKLRLLIIKIVDGEQLIFLTEPALVYEKRSTRLVPSILNVSAIDAENFNAEIIPDVDHLPDLGPLAEMAHLSTRDLIQKAREQEGLIIFDPKAVVFNLYMIDSNQLVEQLPAKKF